ncbi:AT-rich interactive domain-containing protein 5A isoform X2 [Nelusetta ayraudi]|uniref:AT-rich interactive domain-containing protein 5A isoform X2 n=1 Tax=Nelusetta ayraudi TaxID=303726 RepID=UPI003F70CE1E
MDQEDHSEASQPAAASEDESGTETQVTARRLWKKVYDELGGSPGSTSAATCTRRHYEKLVLPFERHIKGEEDKPLPPSKPRKPYKRNLDGKVQKTEKKRKRSHSDREMDPEMLHQRSPEATSQSEAVMQPHPALWPATADRSNPDCPSRAPADCCTSVYARLAQVPTTSPWTAHIPSAAGEVISPLEKKKRVAQASLKLPLSPPSEDKERPSVIHCSQSPARASSSHNCKFSDGSPIPLSSSSSRSPSPYSVSSEDSETGTKEDKSTMGLLHGSSNSGKNIPSSIEEQKSVMCSQIPKQVQNKDSSHVSFQTTDSFKVPAIDSAWKPMHKEGGRYFPPAFIASPDYSLKSDWCPASTSSFTKVIPKTVQPLRPAPIRPGFKTHQGRLMQQDSLACAKKLSNMPPWLCQAEKREKSRTMPQKVPISQENLVHSGSRPPVSCVLSSLNKSVRDSRHQPLLPPGFLSNRMRLPQPQLMYHHVPVTPAHPGLMGSALYQYPYSINLVNPPNAYTFPSIYPYKL